MNPDVLIPFFRLLRLGLCSKGQEAEMGSDVTDELVERGGHISWRAIYELSVRQGVTAIVFDGIGTRNGVNPLPSHIQPPKDIDLVWTHHFMLINEQYHKQMAVVAKLVHFFRAHNINLMLLKGNGLAQLYPYPACRECGDIDIWLFDQQERADRLLEKELGVKVETNHHHHTVFYLDGVMVENHYDFLNQYAHLSNREVEDELRELLEERGYEVHPEGNAYFEDGDVYFLPSVNFTALFLLHHTAKHFAASGICMRHLTDWTVFVREHVLRINWVTLEDAARRANVHRFLYCLNGICVDHLGLSPDFLPDFPRDKALEQRILNDILEHGVDHPSQMPRFFVASALYRLRRWWRNRWKHRIVYPEPLLSSFFVLLRSHFINPATHRRPKRK